MNIGIIGCGLIGHKRASAIKQHTLLGCADINQDRAKQFATHYSLPKIYDNWQTMLSDEAIDTVIIATTHDALAEITLTAINNGKHVFVEKPAARNAEELEPILKKIKYSDHHIRVGFNHRYHRALQKAKKIVDDGTLGELMFIRARYGHGGRLGYEKEWRSNPSLSGGGELIDQGIHLIDLSRWFLGDFASVEGFAHTYFWQMPVEDNGFMLLKNQKKQIAFLHASCTEWKNLFCMEIYGQLGKLVVDGLGGSYGVEKLTHYKMLPEMGPPETTSWEFPMADNSWETELNEFFLDIQTQKISGPTLADAYQALKIIHSLYSETTYDCNS